MGGAMASQALEELRAQVRALEGGAPVLRRRAPSGVEWLDGILGGLPRPGIVEICGPPGTGRARVAAEVLARITAARVAAWVDPLRRLFPPALAAAGVELDRLLLVRPPEDGSQPWIWATEQLLRSGCFEVVVVDRPSEPKSGVGRRPVGARWARAAEQGQSTALVLGDRPARQLAADVRLVVGGGRVMVMRDRSGMGSASAPLPPLER